jgi:uracil-DNA glycosylase family 4
VDHQIDAARFGWPEPLHDQEGRDAAYLDLARRAAACRLCPRMAGRRRVLGAANGPLDAEVLFVAEAPGRFGGDRTGVPLTSDQSGRNFAALLAGAGIARDRVFVTNAVLCNPRDDRGRNAPPSARERHNCRPFLRETLVLVQAPIVAALGRVALDALRQIEPHDLELRRDVGRAVPWHGRVLVPLYHPGPRAQLHRPFADQQRDYRGLRCLLTENNPLQQPDSRAIANPANIATMTYGGTG